MRSALALGVVLVLLVATGFARPGEATISNSYLDAGVGSVDITPNEPVVLAGSPTPLQSSLISTRLYVRALVLSAGGQQVAIVTLDALKYPVEQVVIGAGKSRRPPEFPPATSSSALPTLTAARCGPITGTSS